MKYVKITSRSYNDALMQLRMQYGDDAIPISHKYVKEGGLFSSRFFAKDVVELTAAIHDKRGALKKPMAEKKSTIDLRSDADVSKNIYSQPAEINRNDDFKSLLKATYAKELNQSQPERAERAPQPAMVMEDKVSVSKEEFSELKRFEKEFHDLKDTLNKLIESQKGDAKEFVTEEDSNLKQYKDILKNNDFDDSECQKIMREVKSAVSKDELGDKVKIEKTLKDLLKSRVVTTGPIKSGAKKKIIMFVGPTGVGKTTSLAKLGAIFALRENKKVTFITIDTYRIAATEQLKKYAEIMRIPLHVVSDQKEFRSVVEKEKSDIILVDTSGRSHRNTLKIAEIKSYAEQIDHDFEKILCISATTKRHDADNIFQAFEKVDFNSVMITKTDESSFVGNIINVADKYNKPISYITDGQEVPNDIHVAEREKLVDMMIVGTVQ